MAETNHKLNFEIIEAFFSDYEFSDDEIELSQGETVTDIKKFVESHMQIIKANREQPSAVRIRLTPYWDRLVAIYKLLNLNWNDN